MNRMFSQKNSKTSYRVHFAIVPLNIYLHTLYTLNSLLYKKWMKLYVIHSAEVLRKMKLFLIFILAGLAMAHAMPNIIKKPSSESPKIPEKKILDTKTDPKDNCKDKKPDDKPKDDKPKDNCKDKPKEDKPKDDKPKDDCKDKPKDDKLKDDCKDKPKDDKPKDDCKDKPKDDCKDKKPSDATTTMEKPPLKEPYGSISDSKSVALAYAQSTGKNSESTAAAISSASSG